MLKNNIFLWLVLSLFTTITTKSMAQLAPSLWQDTPERYMSTLGGERHIIPDRYRTVSVDFDDLKSLLEQAPLRFSEEAAMTQVILQIPMPNGEMEAFSIVDAPIMEPGLASKYPYMHAYAGQGIDDPTASIRFDVTQKGFHAMILSARHSAVFIDPYSTATTEHYVSYYKKDYTNGDPFVCEGVRHADEAQFLPTEPLVGDCTLRTYRLALACTGEYAQFHGGNVPDALAAMNTTMVRVNGVYERDATITMVLVDNTDELIYLNGSTDPYSNSNGGAMLDQNQNTIDNVIGTANYDIGHVFSTGGGGIASLNSPCSSTRKAQGVTGQGAPVGDPFDIDYVSHEMGHQYGGNHTQNNNCNSVSGASVEPGSASTIMGYAGICSPNVQNNSDDHFHIYNLREIAANVTGGISSSCPQETDTGNSAPTADAGSNYVIPKSTPFILTGTATDSDNDVLLYNWEQMDAQFASMPPQPNNSGGPMFRSNSPIESPSRYMPNLNAVVNNNNPTWEVLPGVARTLNFTFSVRDNNMGSGCVADDDMQVQVAGNAGPFLVTSPNTAITWMAGNTETVTWDVANTNAAPVSASHVDIMLSTDGGYNFDIVLAENVPNDGSHDIVVPNNEGTNNRVRVMGANNIFYDMSNTNFTIDAPDEPIFTAQVENDFVDVCADNNAQFVVNLNSLGGFNSPVNVAVENLPTGATVSYDNNDVVPNATVIITISDLQNLDADVYNMNILLTGGTQNESIAVAFNLTTTAPTSTTLLTPANGSNGQDLTVDLTWEDDTNASTYNYEVATSPTFDASSIIASGSSASPNKEIQGLEALTVYYWRVTPSNNCGDATGNAQIFAFQTSGSGCLNYSPADTPITISDDSTDEISSIINVNDNVTITSISLPTLAIEHTWVGDISASLTSPTGTSILLFDQVGVPDSQYGCDGDNISIVLSDDADNTSTDLENTCGGDSPSLDGSFQPIDAFSSFDGENAQGTWTLTVADNFNQDGGALTNWQLEVCFASAAPADLNLEQSTLVVESSTQKDVSNTYLSASTADVDAAEITYTIIATVEHGSLVNNGLVLAIGDTFTQADINNNNITYVNNGDGATTDAFTFDILASNGSWTGTHTLDITIVIDDLTATLALTTEMICAGDVAILTATPNGGTAPYTYSIDGGQTYQDSPSFEITTAGEYIITVKDANDFTETSNPVNVIAPAVFNATATTMNNTLTVSTNGGEAPFTYSINGQMPQNDNVFTDLQDGVYTITVTDANGCTTTTEAIIAVESMQITSSINSTPLCADSNEGEIEVNVAGGVPPYTYTINGEGPYDSNIFSNLAAGTYTIVATDDNGSTISVDDITIEAPAALALSTTTNDFEIDASATGGTAPYTYTVNGTVVTMPYTTATNGDYTIEVTDNNGCTTSSDVTISVNTIEIINAIATDANCNGETGSITVNATGGTAPLMYSIDGENFQDSNTFNDLAVGEYTITVQDAEGFTQTTTATVEEPLALGVIPTVGCNTLAGVSGFGGTPDYTYSITGESCFPCDELPNGDYELVITDSNGCTASDMFTIDVVESAMATTTAQTCPGDADGSITIDEVSGGTAPYTYSIDGENFQDSNTFNGLDAGTYTVQIATGDCIFETTATVAAAPAINLNVETTNNTITINATGGTGTLMYSINGGVDFVTDNVFSGLENGTYEIVVEDENGCQVTDSAVIMVDSANDLSVDINWNIFPNPTKGAFSLTLNSSSVTDVVVDIYDVLGRSVYQQELTTNTIHQIDVSHLTAGAYLLTITSDNASATEQLIIQK